MQPTRCCAPKSTGQGQIHRATRRCRQRRSTAPFHAWPLLLLVVPLALMPLAHLKALRLHLLMAMRFTCKTVKKEKKKKKEAKKILHNSPRQRLLGQRLFAFRPHPEKTQIITGGARFIFPDPKTTTKWKPCQTFAQENTARPQSFEQIVGNDGIAFFFCSLRFLSFVCVGCRSRLFVEIPHAPFYDLLKNS